MSLLVVCDHDRGSLLEASLEALTFARPLAAVADLELAAVVIGEGAEAAAVDLGAHGAETVYVASHPVLTDFGPEAWGETVVQLATRWWLRWLPASISRSWPTVAASTRWETVPGIGL